MSAGGKRTAWLESLPAGTSLSIFTQGGVPGSAGARESQPWAQALPMLLWHHSCHHQLERSQAERPPRAEEEATLRMLHPIVELHPGPRLHFLFFDTGPYMHLRTSCLTLPSTTSVHHHNPRRSTITEWGWGLPFLFCPSVKYLLACRLSPRLRGCVVLFDKFLPEAT